MASTSLSSPGSQYGPCPDANCHHTDCQQTRRWSEAICHHCGEAIGYDRQFYDVSPAGGFQLVHASCEILHLDACGKE